jgi:lipoprotein-anchoring transpeptidase ErfK/SrfK
MNDLRVAGRFLRSTVLPAFVCTCAVLVAALQPAHAAAQAKAAPHTPPATLAAAIENAQRLPVLATGAKGPAVIRAQILLDREWFSPGEIDGRFASNMLHALRSFQAFRGLKASGVLDAATWQALQASGATPLARYVLSEADLRGPFAPVPKDIMQRAKLERLGYASPLEALAEKFHVAPRLLEDLNRGRKLQVGSEWTVPDVIDTKPTRKAASILVLKNQKRLLVLDDKEVPLASFPISIGGRRDPLPLGKMNIKNEVDNPTFLYDPKLIWDAKPQHTKVEIAAGPNNPVGSIWLGLSKPHWGIHGTPEPALVGRMETHGCIHLTNWDARRLSTVISSGFAVNVRQ